MIADAKKNEKYVLKTGNSYLIAVGNCHKLADLRTPYEL